MTTTDIHTTARARFFTGGGIERRGVIVEPDGSVLPWDDVAGHYTRCHRLSRRTQQRIAHEARRGEIMKKYHVAVLHTQGRWPERVDLEIDAPDADAAALDALARTTVWAGRDICLVGGSTDAAVREVDLEVAR